VEEVSIIGLDLAKHVFQVHGAGADGSVAFRRKAAAVEGSIVLCCPAALPGMEACATLDEAAAVLVVSVATVRRLIREGTLPAGQLCRGAPWVIRADDLVGPEIKRLADQRRLRRPPSGDPRQNEIGI
jgi:excisionase family DNA binding protein